MEIPVHELLFYFPDTLNVDCRLSTCTENQVNFFNATLIICRLKFADEQNVEKEKSINFMCLKETTRTVLNGLFHNFIQHNEADIRFRINIYSRCLTITLSRLMSF
jgi:hypothetical protein